MSYSWDGFRIDARGMDAALDVVDLFRPRALDLLRQWNAALLAGHAAALIDRSAARGEAPPRAPLSEAWGAVQDRRTRIIREELRDPEVDPEFRLTIMRGGHAVYGLIATEQPEWRAAWHDHPGVSDFSWWNGTDRPDDVSAEEWELRGETLRSLMPDSWPAGHGLVVHLTPRYVRSTPEEVLAAIPSMKVRRTRTALDLATSRRMRDRLGEPPYEQGDLLAEASSAMSWISSPEGTSTRDRIADELDLPVIDMTTLLGFDPQATKGAPDGTKDR
jgi:hypothetical protein